MSHVALRRVMIRMLHDPTLVGAVYADPEGALREVDLTAVERRALAATPAAAWRTDPERPARLRAALADEFPAATSLAPDRAARFFASIHFHRAVQERGSLALAYGDHLAEDGDGRVAAIARLETEIARVRRAERRPRSSPAGFVRLASHAGVVEVRRGTTAAIGAARAGRPLPAPGRGRESVLVLRDATSSEVTLEVLAPTLAQLLRAADPAVRRDDLIRRAAALGAAEAAATIERLIAEGLLR